MEFSSTSWTIWERSMRVTERNFRSAYPITIFRALTALSLKQVHGNSMTGARIYDGDYVFIREQPEVENGEIAAVAIGDEATLKRFYKYGDMVILRAENPEFKEMTFSGQELEHIRVLGKAVAFQSDVR